MKPISIEFQAFGSYPGHERVDFGPLFERGLFVVSGETGTGKSTLFDAMTFALYGAMPLKELRDIRSHHASDSVPTFVRFVFELDGVRHAVERELGPKSAKKSGPHAVLEVKKASLMRLEAAGTVPLATKTTDVTAMCTEMVGLSADQFQRVVLLPQGDVAKFLLAGSADREPLLGALFGGEVFDRVGEMLKADEAELARRLGSAHGDAQRDLAAAREQVRRLVESLGAPGAALVEVGTGTGATDRGGPIDATDGDEGASGSDDGDGSGAGSNDPAAPGDRSGDGADDGHTAERDGALIDADVSGVLAVADREGLVGILDAAERGDGPLARLVAAHTQAQDRERQATAELARVQDAAGRFERLTRVQRALDEARREQPAVDAAAAAAERSRQARPVVEADDQHRRAVTAHAEAEDRRETALLAIDRAAAELRTAFDIRTPAAIATAVQQRRAEIDERRARLDAVVAAEAAVVTANEALMAATTVVARVSLDLEAVRVQQSDLASERQAIAATASAYDELRRQADAIAAAVDARTALDAATVRLHELLVAERQAAAIHVDVLARFVSTTAPRLAADLQPGAPCPVCGALDHPAPATAMEGDAVPYDAVERAAAALATATEARSSAAGECERWRGVLGDDAETPAADLVQRLSAVHDQLRAAEHAGRRIAEIEIEIERLAATEGTLVVEVAEAQAAEGAARTASAAADAALAQAHAAAAGLDAASVDADTRIVGRLEEIVMDLDAVFAGAAEAATAARLAAEQAERVLVASPFAEVAAAHAALVDPTDEAARIAAAEQLRMELDRLTTTIATLTAEGIPDSPPDVEAAQDAAQRAAAERIELDEAVHAASLAATDARAAIDRYDQRVAATAELRARYEIVSRAKKVCVEGGAPRIPLRRWVLARELDRVTAAANVHLARMSAGRYSVHRRLDIVDARKSFGLDLEVRDAHTGRSRAPSSLSGGEQFQASLALALGLADVVSHGGSASGRRFEALFVDEGFGSLDPEALQMAIDALHHLQAGGRMVGVITHVEAMKQDLHIGIEVRRLADGRGSTLVVHP